MRGSADIRFLRPLDLDLGGPPALPISYSRDIQLLAYVMAIVASLLLRDRALFELSDAMVGCAPDAANVGPNSVLASLAGRRRFTDRRVLLG